MPTPCRHCGRPLPGAAAPCPACTAGRPAVDPRDYLYWYLLLPFLPLLLLDGRAIPADLSDRVTAAILTASAEARDKAAEILAYRNTTLIDLIPLLPDG